jgi:hypothetical protein
LRILVCGSRYYTDFSRVHRVLAEYGQAQPVIIHGDAKGADSLAEAAAALLDFATERHVADWATHGKAAGPIRNRQMLDREPNLVIAFGDGKGTRDTVNEAGRRGIAVRRED